MTAAQAYDYRGARDEIFQSAIPGGLKLLLLALVEYMPHCSPSVATLASQCGVERKTVLRGLGLLERASVLAIERRPGERSSYALRPSSDWQPVRTSGTGPWQAPVPEVRTGPAKSPVPPKDGTGPKNATGPVPNRPRTGPTVGPEAGSESRSESGRADGRARGLREAFEAPIRTLSMPGGIPTESYLAACVMAGVRPEQAKSTWAHYWGQGLPPGGVERLEAWLVQRAKEKQESSAKAPARASLVSPGGDLQTTEAATVFRPDPQEAAYCGKHGLPMETAVARCRASSRFGALSTPEQHREFAARLVLWRKLGTFPDPNEPLKPKPNGASP